MVILYLTVSNLTNIPSVIPQISNVYFPITEKLAKNRIIALIRNRYWRP